MFQESCTVQNLSPSVTNKAGCIFFSGTAGDAQPNFWAPQMPTPVGRLMPLSRRSHAVRTRKPSFLAPNCRTSIGTCKRTLHCDWNRRFPCERVLWPAFAVGRNHLGGNPIAEQILGLTHILVITIEITDSLVSLLVRLGPADSVSLGLLHFLDTVGELRRSALHVAKRIRSHHHQEDRTDCTHGDRFATDFANVTGTARLARWGLTAACMKHVHNSYTFRMTFQLLSADQNCLHLSAHCLPTLDREAK